MKEIKLTQSKVTLVDDEDFKRLNRYKWCAWFDRRNYYAARNVYTGKKHIAVRMHREIINAPKNMQVDHIDGNTLNNCRLNLRLCTNQQNAFNRIHAQKNNKLGIKGVSWHKRNKKFQSRIKVNGKEICLGYYNIIGDADSAYRKAEIKYFGDFARR